MIITLVAYLLQGTLGTHGSSGGEDCEPHTMVRVNASSDWTKTYQDLICTGSGGNFDACLGGGNARALVQVSADVLIGNGQAKDAMPFCDVRASSVATASYYESWKYEGKARGYAEVAVRLTASAVANLKNPDCAAAAIGYGSFDTNITEPGVVALDSSAGETESHALGNLTLLGDGFNIPVTIGRKAGRYTDDANAQVNCVGLSDCCTNDFWTSQTLHGPPRHDFLGHCRSWNNAGDPRRTTRWDAGTRAGLRREPGGRPTEPRSGRGVAASA